MHKSKWLVPVVTAILLFIPGCKSKKAKDTRLLVVLQVQAEIGLEAEAKACAERLGEMFRKKGFGFTRIAATDCRTIVVQGMLPQEEFTVADTVKDQMPDWEWRFSGGQARCKRKSVAERQLAEQIVIQVRETIASRCEELGLSERDMKIGQSGDQVMLETASAKEWSLIKAKLLKVGALEFRPVEEGPFASEEEALQRFGGRLPDNLEIMKTDPRQMERGVYVLRRSAVVTGKDVRRATRSTDQYGAPCIALTLNQQGANIMERFSAANIGKCLAVVYDRRIYMVPRIDSVFSLDIVINGRFTEEEVEAMVLLLRSGALASPVAIVEESPVRPFDPLR